MKKFFSKIFLAISLFIMLVPMAVNADTGTKMSFWNFEAGDKGAWLDGSVNNQFYSLTTGNVSLQNFSYTVDQGAGRITSITLYRARTGFDKSYGSCAPTTGMQWTIDTDSSQYYFYIVGKADAFSTVTFSGSGYVHDHGL